MDDKRSLFISHINKERAIATVIQKYIKDAFRDELPIFVST